MSINALSSASASSAWIDRVGRAALTTAEVVAAAALAIDVLIVFASVVWRYFLHDPLEWAEEAARALMIVLVFFGAALALGRGKHVGIDVFRRHLPQKMSQALAASGPWIVALVSTVLTVSAGILLKETWSQTTPLGLPQWLFTGPVVGGCAIMSVVAVAQAMRAPDRGLGISVSVALAAAALLCAKLGVPLLAKPSLWLLVGFLYCLVAGVPIAFALACAALAYFSTDPSLPIAVYSQQVAAGTDHFVLLAIPFFVLAGLVMEVNGMSSRLIELLVRAFGRLRGGVNVIMIMAMAFFSGISGSKLADVAAVGGILMPAVRRSDLDEDDAAALLASSAVMAETIPPCINMIIFGFVANVSIGALFIAGIVPAVFLALCLAVLAVWYGKRADPDRAFPERRKLAALIGGALVGLIMILMIGKGVTSGVATSTEVSAFAVVYALVVGGIAFRELSWQKVYRLFVDSAALAGMILLIVGAASSLSFALTIEQIPQTIAAGLIALGRDVGVWAFVLLSLLLLIIFGAVLEGAPALIIFGPLLTPVAAQLGVNPVHYGIILVIAMGVGLFAPPLGLGLYTTCAVANVPMQRVVKPMMKYLLVLSIGLIVLALVPSITLWLPGRMGML